MTAFDICLSGNRRLFQYHSQEVVIAGMVVNDGQTGLVFDETCDVINDGASICHVVDVALTLYCNESMIQAMSQVHHTLNDQIKTGELVDNQLQDTEIIAVRFQNTTKASTVNSGKQGKSVPEIEQKLRPTVTITVFVVLSSVAIFTVAYLKYKQGEDDENKKTDNDIDAHCDSSTITGNTGDQSGVNLVITEEVPDAPSGGTPSYDNNLQQHIQEGMVEV